MATQQVKQISLIIS